MFDFVLDLKSQTFPCALSTVHLVAAMMKKMLQSNIILCCNPYQLQTPLAAAHTYELFCARFEILS